MVISMYGLWVVSSVVDKSGLHVDTGVVSSYGIVGGATVVVVLYGALVVVGL